MILRRHFEQEIKMINREISKRERKAITEVLENAAVNWNHLREIVEERGWSGADFSLSYMTQMTVKNLPC